MHEDAAHGRADADAETAARLSVCEWIAAPRMRRTSCNESDDAQQSNRILDSFNDIGNTLEQNTSSIYIDNDSESSDLPFTSDAVDAPSWAVPDFAGLHCGPQGGRHAHGCEARQHIALWVGVQVVRFQCFADWRGDGGQGR